MARIFELKIDAAALNGILVQARLVERWHDLGREIDNVISRRIRIFGLHSPPPLISALYQGNARPDFQAAVIHNHALVQSICRRRRLIIEMLSVEVVTLPIHGLWNGQFLIYNPFLSHADGLASSGSEDFFDGIDWSPTDFIVGDFVIDNFRGCDSRTPNFGIVSWIPQELHERVNNGISCNPSGSIYWATLVEARNAGADKQSS